MARIVSARGTPDADALTSVPRRVRTPMLPPGVACESYAPGHQMHYIHQGQALRSRSEHARNVIVDGDRVVIVLASGEQLDWRHHHPDRLTDVLGLFASSRVVYLAQHALRVGPYWFNCADEAFTACEPPAEAAGSSPA